MEMLVVLVIMSLLAGAIAVRFGTNGGEMAAMQERAEIEAQIRIACAKAKQNDARIAIELPGEWHFSNSAGQNTKPACFPDGSATAGAIIHTAGERYALRWIDGALVQ